MGSGTAGASVVLGGNTLTVNTTAATAFDGVISGTGGLVKSNTATLVLAGTNTYSGGTTISAGTLQLGGQASGAPAATVGTPGSGTVTDNANLAFAEPSAVTFGNAISGTGTVMQVGPGTVTLSNTNTYSGGTAIATGTTLGLGGQATGAPSATVGTLGTGAVTDNGTLLLTEPGAVTLANLIGGTGTVTQDGPGIVTLTALNSYSGGTAITGGTLALGNPAGTIGGVGSGAVTDNGTLQFTEPSAVSFGNVISGSGGVLQSGPGAVMLTATNTYSGGTTIVGTLALGDGTTNVGTPGSGAVTVESTGLLEFNEPTAVTIGNAIGGPGMVIQYGPGTVTLTQQETYTGSTVIYNGTLALGSGASIANSGGVTIASTYGSSGFGVLDISQAGNQTVQNFFSQVLRFRHAECFDRPWRQYADRDQHAAQFVRRGDLGHRSLRQARLADVDPGRQQYLFRWHDHLGRHAGAGRPGNRRTGGNGWHAWQRAGHRQRRAGLQRAQCGDLRQRRRRQRHGDAGRARCRHPRRRQHLYRRHHDRQRDDAGAGRGGSRLARKRRHHRQRHAGLHRTQCRHHHQCHQRHRWRDAVRTRCDHVEQRQHL